MTTELRRLPIIKLWDRILVPIQGEITDDLAEALSQEVLREIHESGAHGLVLDLTGVWIMDSHLCSVLSNLASAARLMGTPTIISGLSPEIAMTLQTMGVELEAVRTALSLEQALTMLGLEVNEAGEERPEDEDDGGGRRAPLTGKNRNRPRPRRNGN
ncbi:MAG: STAS domain-containing protein [Minicystis sp.]